MKANEVTASRLKLLRTRRGLSQPEFAQQFSEFTNRETTLSLMTISNWETGRKIPPTDSIVWLCRFYGTSADYILGLTNEEPEAKAAPGEAEKLSSISDMLEIPFFDIAKYHDKPVFISFPNGSMSPKWAIVDYAKKQLICSNMKIALSPNIKYSIATPPELITVQNLARHFIGLEEVLKKDNVYIESLSPDPFLRGQVSGWYHHTPDKTCLINEKGLTLSYEGIDITYRALDTKIAKKRTKK